MPSHRNVQSLQGPSRALALFRALRRREALASCREGGASPLEPMAHWHGQQKPECVRLDRRRHLLEDNPCSG